MTKKGNAPVIQIQVRWGDLATSASTWEDYETLKHHYPQVQIWEEAQAQEEGNVTPDTPTGLPSVSCVM
jgi:hypothetical protein